MKYERDKVYLKDTRNGDIYLYERLLAKNRNFVEVVPNPSPKKDAESDENKSDEKK